MIIVVRPVGTDGEWAAGAWSSPALDGVGYRIIRLDSGPQGPPSRQDIPGFAIGPVGSGELLGVFNVALDAASTFSAENSVAKCEVAPTAQVVITLTKNGTPWATITYEAGEVTGTVEFLSADNYVVGGDQIKIYAPVSVDVTFETPSFTIASA